MIQGVIYHESISLLPLFYLSPPSLSLSLSLLPLFYLSLSLSPSLLPIFYLSSPYLSISPSLLSLFYLSPPSLSLPVCWETHANRFCKDCSSW